MLDEHVGGCAYKGDILDRKWLLLNFSFICLFIFKQNVTNLDWGVEVLCASASTKKSVGIGPVCWIMPR